MMGEMEAYQSYNPVRLARNRRDCDLGVLLRWPAYSLHHVAGHTWARVWWWGGRWHLLATKLTGASGPIGQSEQTSSLPDSTWPCTTTCISTRPVHRHHLDCWDSRRLRKSRNTQFCNLDRVIRWEMNASCKIVMPLSSAWRIPDCRSSAAWRAGGQYIELAAVRDDVKAA